MKQPDFSNKLTPVLIILLVIASFLLGSMYSKIKYLEGGAEIVTITKGGKPTTPPSAPTRPPFEPKKSAKPQVKFFVMSYCPFGNQAENGLEPVYQLLKDKVDWQPRYVIYTDYCDRATGEQKTQCEKTNCLKTGNQIYCSMHGVAELNQGIREICVFKQGNWDKFWQFIKGTNTSCTVANIESCWKGEAQKAGINISQTENCQARQKFTLAKAETEEMEKYQAFGSPAVFINDVSYNGGRAPEDYKKAICSSFENKPEKCDNILGEESVVVEGGCN